MQSKDIAIELVHYYNLIHSLKYDSIEKVANYLIAASNFIDNLLEQQNILPPFQIDFNVIVKKVTSNSKPTMVDMSSDDDDEDDDDDDDDAEPEQKDDGGAGANEVQMGDIFDKLKTEKITYVSKDIDDSKGPEESGRIMVAQFNEFKDALNSDKPNKTDLVDKDPLKIHRAYDPKSYPHRKRFEVLVDRREAKDKMTFFEPPFVCDSLPETDHVPEWFFESVRKCIIPRKGYGDGEKETDQNEEEKDNQNTTITGQTGCGGELLTFSYHVEAADQIKCYMYWMAQVMRFYPEDIIQTFKHLFTKKRYETFKKSKKYEKMVKQINITDKEW
eukprot:210324_1